MERIRIKIDKIWIYINEIYNRENKYQKKKNKKNKKNKKEENNPPSSNHFIPIKIKTPLQNNCPIEIQLPNKIILRCKDWSSRQLTTLISKLQKIEFTPQGAS